MQINFHLTVNIHLRVALWSHELRKSCSSKKEDVLYDSSLKRNKKRTKLVMNRKAQRAMQIFRTESSKYHVQFQINGIT